jgi:hypothetical protein
MLRLRRIANLFRPKRSKLYRINAAFERFRDVNLYQCVGTIGVYVVWDDASEQSPTYIGKGNLFNRLESHHSKFEPPLDGHVAILGELGDRKADHDAEILEGMLLWVAEQTGRLPENNRQRARLAKIKEKLKKHRLVRARLRGRDPFGPPHTRQLVSGDKKFIRVFLGKDGMPDIEHSWRRLRGTGSE